VSDIVKARMQTRVSTQVEKTLEGLYVSLVYSGWQSLAVQDMLADAIANILIEEYDTKQQRLDRICFIAERVINTVNAAPERTDEPESAVYSGDTRVDEETDNVDSQDQ
jgi:hypothetical protein